MNDRCDACFDLSNNLNTWETEWLCDSCYREVIEMLVGFDEDSLENPEQVNDNDH